VRPAGSSRIRYSFLFLGVILLALAVYPSFWLRALGAALIHDDGPAKADLAVVLAGDQWGNRILKSAELVRDGYVPAVLVSGPPFYAAAECDLAIELAVKCGYPRSWFIPFPNGALSTSEEATAILSELERRKVQSILLVTSDYHTARSRRIYRAAERRVGGGLSIRAVAAPDKYFHANSWWRSREGLKIGFMELTKTVATAMGI
jgi:uncharacterized SAM-binding protein YcdF (DUF218 family)